MSNDPEQPQLVPLQYTPEFKRNIRQLAKKYRRIKTEQEDIAPHDIQQIILDYQAQMQATGEAAEDVTAPDRAAGDVTSASDVGH